MSCQVQSFPISYLKSQYQTRWPLKDYLGWGPQVEVKLLSSEGPLELRYSVHPHKGSVVNGENPQRASASHSFPPQFLTNVLLLDLIIDYITWSHKIPKSVLVLQKNRTKGRERKWYFKKVAHTIRGTGKAVDSGKHPVAAWSLKTGNPGRDYILPRRSRTPSSGNSVLLLRPSADSIPIHILHMRVFNRHIKIIAKLCFLLMKCNYPPHHWKHTNTFFKQKKKNL